MSTIWNIYKSNFFCADLLLKNRPGFSEPSAHFVNYGVFHLIQYILCHKIGISYEEQDNKSQGANSHTKLINLFYKDLNDKLSINSIDIKMKISRIKRNRSLSDYSNDNMCQQFLADNYKEAISLISEIKPLYGISA